MGKNKKGRRFEHPYNQIKRLLETSDMAHEVDFPEKDLIRVYPSRTDLLENWIIETNRFISTAYLNLYGAWITKDGVHVIEGRLAYDLRIKPARNVEAGCEQKAVKEFLRHMPPMLEDQLIKRHDKPLHKN